MKLSDRMLNGVNFTAPLLLSLSIALTGCVGGLQYEVVPLREYTRAGGVEYVLLDNCKSNTALKRSGTKNVVLGRSLELGQTRGVELEPGVPLKVVSVGVKAALENQYGFRMTETLTDSESYSVEPGPHSYAIVSLTWSERREAGNVRAYSNRAEVGITDYEITTDLILSIAKTETYLCDDKRLVQHLLEICDQYSDREKVDEARDCYSSVLELSPGNNHAMSAVRRLAPTLTPTERPATTTPALLGPVKVPSPLPTLETLYRVVNVSTTDVLYMRFEPGVNSPILGFIPSNGRDVRITGVGKRIDDSCWVPTKYKNTTGWVNSYYLAEQSSPLDQNTQIPPIQVVRDYYSAINNRQYEVAWEMLSPPFKERPQTGSYTDYLAWWNRVDQVEVGEVRVITLSDGTAIVDAQLRYQMKDGRLIEDRNSHIQLGYDSDRGTWLLNDKGC